MFKTSLSICCFLGVWGGLKVVEVNTIKSANQWWIIAEQTNHLRCTGGLIITLNCIVRNPQKRVIGPVRPWGGTRGAISEQRAAAAWLAMAFKSGSQWRLLWAGRGLADRKKSSVHYATEWDGVMCDIEKAFYHHVLSSVRRVWALDIKWRVESESQTEVRCSKKWASAEEMVCREGRRHQEVVTLYVVSVSYQQRDWVQKCSTCEGPQAPRGRGGGALWEEAPCRCVFPCLHHSES